MTSARLIAERPMSTAPARAFWSALDAAVGPISLLAILAALVRTLGAAEYGILAIALAASGISMAVNPAIATTTTKFVSEVAAGRGSTRRTLAGIVSAALCAVLLIDTLLIAITSLWNGPLSNWLFGAATAFPGEGMVLSLAMAAVAIQQLDSVLGAAIRGLERFRRQALIELFMRITLMAAVIIASIHGRSVVAALLAQCIVFAIFAVVRAGALRALLPDRKLFVVATGQELRSLVSYGGWMWLTAIAGVAYTNCDRIIVGRLFGLADAGEYSIYIQITQLIHFIPSSLFAFSLPAFSRLEATGVNHHGLGSSYRRYLGAICVCAVGLALMLLAVWPWIAQFLAAGNIPAGGPKSTPLLLIVNFLILSISVAPYYLLLGLGHSRFVSLTISFWMGASLLLMAVLIPRYGMAGAAVARLAYGLGALTFLVRAQRIVRGSRGL